MIGAVREAAKALDPDQPLFAVRTLNDAIAEARWPYRVFGTLFVIFAIIALVLSSVGIYAITSYSVTQRTPELGLRLALGAQASQISWLILRTGLWQLGIGLTLGLGAAFGVIADPQVARRADPRRRSRDLHRHHGAAHGRHADRLPHPGPARDADGPVRGAAGGLTSSQRSGFERSACGCSRSVN